MLSSARIVVMVAVLGHAATADSLRHEDAELVRPELVAFTAITYEPVGGKLVATARESRAYDRAGRITRQEHRDRAGKLVVAYDFTWDAKNRLLKRRYVDNTGRRDARIFTYKTDATGRITERAMRDPSKAPGEFIRDDFLWEPSGRRTEQSYRHYPKEGPYRSGSKVYDGRNRLERSCSEAGGCEMYEYDANGEVSRIRQQHGPDHAYLVYENTYDASGRLVRRILGGTDSTFRWNARGDVVEVVDKEIASQGGRLKRKTVYTYRYR